MPDKARFVSEIVRLLQPGGRVVTGTWNLRDTRTTPLTTAAPSVLYSDKIDKN